MSMRDVFGASGLLARAVPGYSPREGQVEMATACDRVIRDGGRLIVEAPTGVGKSAAYLAPILAAGKRAIVTTANIALSEQIVNKDAPMLAAALGSPVRVALAKGMNNYLCRDALEDFDEHDQRDAEFLSWARETTTGDFSEYTRPIHPSRLLRAGRGSEDCLRAACDHFESCCALGARAAAAAADVVVTNYHLLFAHLEILANGAEQGLLPDVDVLVLDEAHKVSEIARGFVGRRTTEYSVRKAIGALGASTRHNVMRQALDQKLHSRIYAEASTVFARAARPKPGRIKRQGLLGASALHAALRDASGSYGEAIRDATSIRIADGDLFGPSMPGKLRAWYREARKGDEKRVAAWVEKLRISGRSCVRIAQSLALVDGLSDPGELVHYTERTGERGAFAVCSVPIETGPYVRDLVWKADSAFRSVIATSATLRDGSTSFSHVVRELGAEGAETLAVESPFDFSRVMLVCDSDWPEPKDPRFAAHLVDTLERTVDVAGGRTLGLFASWRALEATHAALLRRLGDRYRVLKQGDAPRSELVRLFREDETSVLLGVESFWAGVDVPGRALSALWIEKIPFSSPDDPVFDALDERYGRAAFARYSVPRAVLQFRQGFGRLVRTMTDEGIVVVADPRIFTASYGGRFTSTLPEACVAGTFEDAREHLREYLKGKVDEGQHSSQSPE